MSNTITFENLAQKIADGLITADEISEHSCAELSAEQKTALLTALANKAVSDNTDRKRAVVFSGQFREGTLSVPDFLAGQIQVIDTDESSTDTLDGTHEYVGDSKGDRYPEESVMEWPEVTGLYYENRDLVVPLGVVVLYTFILR